jgi:hypothetical protein
MNIINDPHYFDADIRYLDPKTNTLECFRDIPGYEGKNQVSNFGRVLSINSPKLKKTVVLKPMNYKGYFSVDLRGNQKNMKIHRLVGIVFLPNPDCLPDMNHKDTDKGNNFVNNLEWSTTSDNVQHSWDHDLQVRPIGELSARSKFTNDQVKQIIARINSGESCSSIAREMHVCHSTISRMKLAKTYSSVTQ